MSTVTRTPEYHRIRARGLELLKTRNRNEVREALEAEFGVPITRQAVANWDVAYRNRGGRPPSRQPDPMVERLDSERDARIAALPHRCPTCHGVGPAGICSWCRSVVP